MLIEVAQQTHTTLLLPKMNRLLSPDIKNEWFDINYWQQQKSVTGQSIGRNITWFVEYDKQSWVLRHYYRGGLMGKLLTDQYLFTQLANSRCYQELLLLENMFQQGLPVPKPIAGRVIKNGLFYQADLLIEKIQNSEDLVKVLQHAQLSEDNWREVGVMVAKFHDAGIYHSDLNAHNILIDSEQKLWLIDFDKCQQRKIDKKWQQENLARLLRSFKKEKGIYANFHFDEQAWCWLLAGYQEKCR